MGQDVQLVDVPEHVVQALLQDAHVVAELAYEPDGHWA